MAESASTPAQKRSAWQASGAAQIQTEPAEHGGYTLAELDEVADSIGLWARLHGKVEHRLTKEVVPWEPTVLQRRMIAHYEYCRDADIPCRMIVLKIRRGGGSTGAAGLVYVHLHNYRTRAGVIGTDYEVSANLMAMAKHFDRHDDFPGWQRASKVIDDKMEWPNESTLQRYTAENPEASRSAGLQAYQASEGSRWQDSAAISAKETLRSLRGSVPRHGFTLGIEESTAQGATGPFAETFIRGRWPEYASWWNPWGEETPDGEMEFGEDLQYVRIFAAWFEDSECRVAVTPAQEARIGATLSKTERDLIERYRSDGPRGDRLGTEVETTVWEQLAWRRMVISAEFDDDEEAFDQENPSSPAVAFASSGRHTFHRGGVSVMRTAAPNAIEYGVLTEQPVNGVVFTRTGSTHSWIELYEEPREGYRYVLGVDTMTGKEQVKNSGVSDWNAGLVIRAPFIDDEGRKRPMLVVAALRPKNDDNADILCDHCFLLSKFYGNCMVVPEVNGSGYGFLALAKKLGMHLYRREDFDKVTQETTEHAGWKTDAESRPQIITALQRAIRANVLDGTRGEGNGLLCPNKTACSEAAAMTLRADGLDRAPHDDHVIALGLAVVNISGATYFSGHRRKRRGPADRKNWRKSGI